MSPPPAFRGRTSLTNCLVRGAISMTRLLALAYDMPLPIGVQALAPLVQRYLRLVHAPPSASIVHHDADTQSAAPCASADCRAAPGPRPPSGGGGAMKYSRTVST